MNVEDKSQTLRTYGIAAAEAYDAYKDNAFLGWAETTWNSARPFIISDSDVQSGKALGKSTVVQKSCSGASLAGGGFWASQFHTFTLIAIDVSSVLLANRPLFSRLGYEKHGVFCLQSSSIVDFYTESVDARLSGLLAEATGNQTYLDAASQSLNFIHDHLYNSQHIVDDGIKSDTCTTQTSFAFPYNSAYMIEGMSILSTITKNQSTLQLPLRNLATLRLRDTLAATVYNKAWQKDNGVISYGSGNSGDWNMVHALSTVYRRNSTEPDLRSYIRDYLTVQYNALSDLATAGSSIYGSSWIGPPGTQLDPVNQTTALTVLISGIALRNTTASSVPPPVESGGTPSGSNTAGGTRSSTGAIVGGSIGGVVLLIGIGIGVWWLLRRRRRHQQKADKTAGIYAERPPVSNDSRSDYSREVSSFPGYSSSGGESMRSLGRINRHLTPVRLSVPPSSQWSSAASSTDQGTSSVSELAEELKALRLQHSRIQERIWEEEDGPPPEYDSIRSAGREQYRDEKGR
ncbi:hypothetical protein AAF712_011741 [Marasmius tenuissimus]|uniref:Glycoside hydrolase family 76 protein n=1 Tax=Marasmius tenuissimus TaxID=585030 RepID=A0ABR2ZJS9_9AGAR